ncbi:hypothetical protein SAICODRAFT_66328 [Saitoella complicata NRRL Y-17804]|uniref:uncharacterized protein n=1 Tax=Saitoella complicata (strain BCRC 22490 / CBS 7301 / JCM 7358 / NBRC 10748 / NRRL Y-17804) TaxID=698492 RepID=UPI0008680543|nr:uncharacterized protein SAICODRAFT_66328 [Saitoella complicata NRRL Y-17804]ODQ52364.1 hypothetical protein SAICODRAFT_66328 [Saitoella complicata NRRL Y-17804]
MRMGPSLAMDLPNGMPESISAKKRRRNESSFSALSSNLKENSHGPCFFNIQSGQGVGDKMEEKLENLVRMEEDYTQVHQPSSPLSKAPLAFPKAKRVRTSFSPQPTLEESATTPTGTSTPPLRGTVNRCHTCFRANGPMLKVADSCAICQKKTCVICLRTCSQGERCAAREGSECDEEGAKICRNCCDEKGAEGDVVCKRCEEVWT